MRVASIPATHVYVRHLDDPDGATVDRVADPSGDDHRTPCFLDPAWWRRHATGYGIDVLHVHFGFEFQDAARLEDLCAAAHRVGIGIVHTVHDLRNPNHARPELHDRGLDVWLEHADELVTLTPWAAEQVIARCGRRPRVSPHPHVVPLEELARRAQEPPRQHAERVRVALHLKSLRPNTSGARALAATIAAVDDLPRDVRLRVDLHGDVADPTSASYDAEVVALAWDAAARSDARVDLHLHPYLSDDELWELIAGAEVFVLPYRFGTHSGLLEACRDLGTAVVAPAAGGYGAQGAQHLFTVGADGEIDAASLQRAVRAASVAPRPRPVPVVERRRQRVASAALHREVYADAAGAAAAAVTAAAARHRAAG